MLSAFWSPWIWINMIYRLGSYMIWSTFLKFLPMAHLHLRGDLSRETSKNCIASKTFYTKNLYTTAFYITRPLHRSLLHQKHSIIRHLCKQFLHQQRFTPKALRPKGFVRLAQIWDAKHIKNTVIRRESKTLRCHEKWHCKITSVKCICHETWHCDITE